MIIISIHIRRKNFYLLCGEINLTGKEKRKFPGDFDRIIMKYIMVFLKNSIVIGWIAPVVTTLIATIIIKKITIINSSKVINKANQDYVNTILVFIKKKMKIDEGFVHGVRNALALEVGVPESKLYSDGMLRDVLVNNLARDTSMLEKTDLIL
ncbi:MAG: hypothetical protein ACLUUW_03305 [Blautia wexlerae]